MTPDLYMRWKHEQAPFDGRMVRSATDHGLTLLRVILLYLHSSLGRDDTDLHVYRDWHERDGVLANAEQYSWDQLAAALHDESTLYDSRDVEPWVRVAIHSSRCDWLLRYNIHNEQNADYTTAWGNFDFSCTPACDAAGLITKTNELWPTLTTVEPAKLYFDRSHCQDDPRGEGG